MNHMITQPDAGPTPPLALLVIDDESGLRDMLSHTFTRRGWKVTAVESGEKGVAAAREEDFDVVLCDVMMPGMDGIAVLEILKRERPHVEVVMVTGFPSVETGKRAGELGAYAYLAKPYELTPLFALLQKAAELKRRLEARP